MKFYLVMEKGKSWINPKWMPLKRMVSDGLGKGMMDIAYGSKKEAESIASYLKSCRGDVSDFKVMEFTLLK